MLTLSSLRRVPSGGRRALATAGLASVAVIGTMFSGTAAAAADTPPASGQSSALGGYAVNLAADSTTITPATPTIAISVNHSSVYKRHPVFVTGVAKVGNVADRGRYVVLQINVNHAWTSIAHAYTAANGAVRFTVKPTVTRAYRIATPALKSGDATILRAAASGARAVKAVDIGAAIVTYAAKFKGHRYAYGAAGPRVFDCSGLVQYVYKHVADIKLPHKASSQDHHGKRVSRANARPGDLIFFRSGGHVYHVAIYTGHNMMWEAPHPGAHVRHVTIWSKKVEFRRLVQH